MNNAASRVRPGRIATAFNGFVGWLARHGVSLYGSRELAVRGRTTGEWRTVPVNLLRVAGADYLVAPRGEVQWVKNLRVAGGGEIRLGRRVEPFTASAAADDEALPVLRAYLRKWSWEVGAFFPGLSADSPDEDLRAALPRHPVFRIARLT